MKVFLTLLCSLISLLACFANELVPSSGDQVVIQNILPNDSVDDGMVDHGNAPLSKESFVSTQDLKANGIEIKETGDVHKAEEKRVKRLRLASSDEHVAYHLIDVTEKANGDPTTVDSVFKHGIRRSNANAGEKPNPTNIQRNLHIIHHHHSEPTTQFVEVRDEEVDRSLELPPLRYHEFSMPNTTPAGY